MEKLDKETLAFEMARQLHEQYSANDNAKTNNIIAFLAAIAFIFIGYGYVYVRPYFYTGETSYYSSLLFYVDIIVNVILVLISVFCVNSGYSTRRDHIVITRIRELYAKSEMEQWFKGKYNGCGKTIFKFLPNYYLIMFVFVQVFIGLLILGCCNNIYVQSESFFRFFLVGTIAIIINIGVVLYYFYYKYRKFQTEKERKNNERLNKIINYHETHII